MKGRRKIRTKRGRTTGRPGAESRTRRDAINAAAVRVGASLVPVLGPERIMACRTEADWLALFDEIAASGLDPHGALSSEVGRQAAAALGANAVAVLGAPLRANRDEGGAS